ncbi:MAG: CDP-alcohol phosphatidyltransferase family protein [Solirubrobacteraceae bacterium]
MTTRRLLGLDRSGPLPEPTRSGQPLRPFTIPNGIGLIRLLLIPVFLVVALSQSSGRDALAAAIFAVIAWADYLDGFTARLTGQYSRLGALLDPVIDRLLVISGMAVAWRFSLLPAWALALVIARELLMLTLSRMALRRDIDIKINWAGRIAVLPTMSAPFFAMLSVHLLALVLLYLGLTLALSATVAYIRTGLEELRIIRQGSSSD